MATVRPDGAPHVVPITFAVANGMLVTAVDAKPKRTPRLQRLANLRANPAVSILVDQYAEDWGDLWWIRVDGSARILTSDDPERTDAIEALVAKYEQYEAGAPEGPVIAVRPASWMAWSARA